MSTVLKFITLGSSFILFLSLVINTTITVAIIGIAYLLFVNIILFEIIKISKQSIVGVLFVIFFSIGHILKTGVVLANHETYKVIGWNTIGSFEFDTFNMTELFAVQLAGILGAYFSFKWLINGNHRAENYYKSIDTIKCRVNRITLALVWSVTAICLIAYMMIIGIGMHGLEPQQNSLPAGVAGLLLYLRNIFIISVGLMLLDRIYQQGKRPDYIVFIFLYLVVILFLSVASLSRGIILVSFLPVVYAWFLYNKPKIRFKLLIKLLILMIPIYYIFNLVNLYRLEFYNDSVLNVIEGLRRALKGESKFTFDNILLFFDFLVMRVEGSRELMAVISAELNGSWIFIKSFLYGDSTTMESVMGFLPTAEGKAFGMTYGLIGFLYLSKNIFLVFFGVSFYMAYLIYIERLFVKKRYYATSLYITFTLFLNVWGNMDWFFMFRFTFVVLLTYFFSIYVIERVVPRYPAVRYASKPTHA